jgi:hypothetical protein
VGLPPRLPSDAGAGYWVKKREAEREERRKRRGYRAPPSGARNDPLSSLGDLNPGSVQGFPCDFRLTGVASVLHPYRRPHVPHLQHDLRFLYAGPRVRDNRAASSPTCCNCTLWVIACDKCPECPTFLRDVNGLDLGHRDARDIHTHRARGELYSLLSISHAYPTRRRVVEKRL